MYSFQRVEKISFFKQNVWILSLNARMIKPSLLAMPHSACRAKKLRCNASPKRFLWMVTILYFDIIVFMTLFFNGINNCELKTHVRKVKHVFKALGLLRLNFPIRFFWKISLAHAATATHTTSHHSE